MEKNKNILKFPDKFVKNQSNAKNLTIKNFCGFDYIKMDKDLNGTPFIKENLIDYSVGCMYMVRVMREKSGKTYLYNYYVSQDRLCEFLNSLETGKFDGKLIEVEKYIPEDLA